MKKMRRRNNPFLNNGDDDIDPVSSVANLFDVAMVFAVALMVAFVTRFNMQEFFSDEDFTLVKNPGKEQMEIITNKSQSINLQKIKIKKKIGKKIGTHQLESGEVIYIED